MEGPVSEIKPLHRRADGSYVIELNGMPYHCLPADPLFKAEWASLDLTPEPGPRVPTVAPFYSGAAIAAAMRRWGPSSDEALEGLTNTEWFELQNGVTADSPALAALLAAAGKTISDI